MEISIVIKMQQVNFETSMKNIPLGGKKEYVMQLTKSVRKVVYAMSWAAFIFLNNIQCEEKETYGFRSQKKMPIVEELEDFIPSVADDPFGETDCSTHGIDSQLVILCIMSS